MSAAKAILDRTRAIQSATLAAKKRTGDNSIAVRVKQGRGQIVGIDYNARGTCDEVREISEWMPLAEVPAALDRIPAP